MKSLPTFKSNYVLIDYENVHPKNIPLLTANHFHIYLFYGALQNKIPISLAQTMLAIGDKRAKYIGLKKTGNNALDFHIAYYVGELAAKNPKACFHIISKDTGYDPLIEHLKLRNIDISRRSRVSDIPILTYVKDLTEKTDSTMNEKFMPSRRG